MELGKLQELIDLLRANGVTSFDNGELSLKLGPAPKGTDPDPEQSREKVLEQTEMDLRGVPGNYLQLFEVRAAQ